METDFIEESYVMYGLGVLLGVFAVFYFGFEILQGLSPVTKSALLLGVALSFFAAGYSFSQKLLRTALQGLGAVSYVVFVGYLMLKFGFSKEIDFLVLAFSSAIFLGVGYMVGQGFEVPVQRARQMLVALVLAGLLMVAVDVSGPQPRYDLQLHDNVTLVEGEPVEIGVLRISNDFFLPREVDPVRYETCSSAEQRFLLQQDSPGTVGGDQQVDVSLKVRIPSAMDENVSLEGVYPVKFMEECPAENSGVIYVVESRYQD
ncbi:MAG: hypothetical protein ABEJ69_03400 [Candidatus Nanohaloarchaea archaeon]